LPTDSVIVDHAVVYYATRFINDTLDTSGRVFNKRVSREVYKRVAYYTFLFNVNLYAVHDYFKHAGGRDIFLLDWRQVLSYDVSFLNIRFVVNSVINLVNKNLPRTALQICMFHFNYNFTIIVPNAFNYLKNVTTWEQCSVEL
jgi:hypothetical protein